MISTWRRKKAARRAAKMQDLEKKKNAKIEVKIPDHFRCPISSELMKDPVTLSTGMTYNRESIESWFQAGNSTCPVTKQNLRSLEPIPNHSIRKMIQEWCVENKSYGIERIPTPKVPISSAEVLEILAKVEDAVEVKDCQELVMEIRTLAMESELNKRRFVANGAGKVLSSKLEAFSRNSMDNIHVQDILSEIMTTLTAILPLDEEAKGILGSKSSLRSIVWFLGLEDISQRNAALLLKSILSSNAQKVGEVMEIPGALEAFVKLVKESTSPITTKATLLAMYHMVSSSSMANGGVDVAKRFAEIGLVEILLDLLVSCEKGICEKALGVLDGICNSSDGREKAYGNALTTPILVKKLLRVSDLATEISVSILWKLGNDQARNESCHGVIFEAVELGAFQKLLLLLQVGSTEKTKEKASQLLKLMNLYRNRVECIDSLDFKDLKRPF